MSEKKPLPPPPRTYVRFRERFKKLGTAWEMIGEAGREGPMDAKTRRLVKLAISVGAMREGAVHSGVRKALAAGASREEIEQVLALAAGTMGYPATVAAFTWIGDELGK